MSCGAVIQLLTIPTYMSGRFSTAIVLASGSVFTYGMDVLLTRPDTERTINGINEEEDSINEIGAYLQSETKILPQLKFIAAGRVDDHNQLEDLVLSPRVALAYQPNDDHNLRVTYNRAFNTPRTSDLFLDILSVGDAFGLGANFQPVLGFSPNIDIRAQGVPLRNGVHLQKKCGRSSRIPFSLLAVGKTSHQRHTFHLTILSFTNVMWNIGTQCRHERRAADF